MLKLTPAQQKAVNLKNKNVLVSAGAGTGKTRVLVERFLKLIEDNHAAVNEILALTFTEKAANEMKSRIMARFLESGKHKEMREMESAYISTIHAFASRLLKEHPIEAGVDPDFRVLESDEADFLKDQAMDESFSVLCEKGNEIFELVKVYGEEELKEGLRRVLDAARQEGKSFAEFFAVDLPPAAFLSPADLFEELHETELAAGYRDFEKIREWDWSAVNRFRDWRKGFSMKRGKKGGSTWSEIKKRCDDFETLRIGELTRIWHERFKPLALKFEEVYERIKKEKGCLDFDDLQIRALRLFERKGTLFEKLLERYREKFKYIMIDEFQDTNALQFRLARILTRSDNLFFVGDYKQSIYGFRGAEPGFFLEAEKSYDQSEGSSRICLQDNFRAQPEVLDFINRFFRELWQEDGYQMASLKASKKTVPGAGVELLRVVSEKEELLDHARFREADSVAERIEQLYKAGTPFGDMVILFQAVKEIGPYEQALKKREIPYYTLSGRGFYHQHEIRDMVSYLSFLENPYADIPLAAALRSPLFQIKDDALFWLSYSAKNEDRFGEKPTPLYDGIKCFKEITQIPDEEKKKLSRFSQITDEIFKVKARVNIAELIDLILEKTSYELTVLADPQGARRYSNLKKLANLARKFESYEPMALGDFIRTVRRLETQEVRESEAQVEAEKSGKVVRIMSIHRSKGLEFPVVFVADMGRRKQSGESRRIIAEPGRGFFLQGMNEETGVWESPFHHRKTVEEIKAKEKAEWKRLLYVAATRAERRLIFSGVSKEKKSAAKDRYSEMSTWMDWFLNNPECETGIEIKEIKTGQTKETKRIKQKTGKAENLLEQIKNAAPEKGKKQGLKVKISAVIDQTKRVRRQLSRVIDLPVSAFAALKKGEEDYRRTYEMGYGGIVFNEERNYETETEEAMSAQDFGTAMHRILEFLDFSHPEKNKKNLLTGSFGLPENPDRREAEEMLNQFMASSVSQKIKDAKRIEKEIPFLLNERHGLIHGVIDVLFQDKENKWHVLDYKTGEGDEVKAGSSGYDKQIEIYAAAVYRLTGIMPDTGIVYFMKNGYCQTYLIDEGWMKSAEERLRKDQEQMLEIRNESLDGRGVTV